MESLCLQVTEKYNEQFIYCESTLGEREVEGKTKKDKEENIDKEKGGREKTQQEKVEKKRQQKKSRTGGEAG